MNISLLDNNKKTEVLSLLSTCKTRQNNPPDLVRVTVKLLYMTFVKRSLSKESFHQSKLDQSVEALTTNLKVVGSSTTVYKNFSFCIIFSFLLSLRSLQVDCAHTNEVKNDIHPR